MSVSINIGIEIIGWVGAVLVLIAYIAVTTGRITGASPTFQWLNALGAGFFVLNTWWHGAMPSMVLNIIWSLLGFVTLWRMRRQG
ncbi:hypothetical protein BH10PSE12_BH10PSE12_35110 [soil metagenome]